MSVPPSSAARSETTYDLWQTDDEFIAVFRRELAEIVGLTAEPRFTRVCCCPQALPQCNLGHPARGESQVDGGNGIIEHRLMATRQLALV